MTQRIAVIAVFAAIALPATARAYGEPEDGYPTMEELWVEVYTSSCRQDPDAWQHVWGAPAYGAMGPLWHHHGLNVVARNHSQDMADHNWFDHNSSDGTSWDARIREYYSGGMIGENIAAGYATAYDVMVGWLNSDGHRENIFTSGYQEIGVGMVHGGSYGIYWTQDFGGNGPADAHPIPCAAAEQTGDGLRVWAVVHERNVDDEPDVMLALEDDCHPMDLIYGATGEGTYEAVVPAAGSNRWTVQIRLADGSVEVWPDTGSWDLTGWGEDEPAADCFGTGGDDDDDDTGDDDVGDDDGVPHGPDGGSSGGGCAANSPFSDPSPGTYALGLMALLSIGRRRLRG